VGQGDARSHYGPNFITLSVQAPIASKVFKLSSAQHFGMSGFSRAQIEPGASGATVDGRQRPQKHVYYLRGSLGHSLGRLVDKAHLPGWLYPRNVVFRRLDLCSWL
jgi:hypothetical protein